jgi:nucleoside-diphosphate-sugar epimerase
MKCALVTGAAGFIGSHLTEELIDRGYDVRALDSLATGSLNNLESIADHDSFTFIDGDIRDKETLDSCIEGVDYVFHQAAVASVQRSFEQPSVVSDINCTGTSMLLEAAKKADVETVVVASSAAVYGSGGELPKREAMPVAPESPYALSKQYTEQAAVQIGAEYDFNAVGLRYFNVFGPRQDPEGEYAAVIPKFISLMISGDRPTVFGDGEQSRDFVFVDDVVAANIQAAESGVTGEVFNIARGERTTINELVDQLNEILGADIEPRYEAPRPGDIRHSVAEISKARNQLDYEASTSFKDGLRQTVMKFQ